MTSNPERPEAAHLQTGDALALVLQEDLSYRIVIDLSPVESGDPGSTHGIACSLREGEGVPLFSETLQSGVAVCGTLLEAIAALLDAAGLASALVAQREEFAARAEAAGRLAEQVMSAQSSPPTTTPVFGIRPAMAAVRGADVRLPGAAQQEETATQPSLFSSEA